MAPQNLSGPLSGMVQVSVRDVTGLIRNLNAKEKRYLKAAEAVTRTYADEAERMLKAETPVDKGNMQRLAKAKVSEKGATFEFGWWREDFTAEGLRWYVPYVLFGTRFMAARPVHLHVESAIRPRHLAALKAVFREETNRP